MRLRIIRYAFEIAVVAGAISVLSVRAVRHAAYQDYLKSGGTRSFWSWVGAGDETLAAESQAREEDAAREKAKKEFAARQAAAKTEAEELVRLQQRAKELQTRLKTLDAAAKQDVLKRKRLVAAKGRGGKVKTGGKSSHTTADGRTAYRVSGIQGIEFGTSDNAPGPNVKPLLSVSYDANGNQVFEQLKWREYKQLTDSVYGFENAWLDHSIDSEQLSSVTFNKTFPFTEEGLQEAMAFYESMSQAAAADLGFEPVTVDRTDKLREATVCGFTNKGGETTIRGGVQAYSDDHFNVTLTVSDNAYQAEARAQSNAAYESGTADAVDAKVEVWRRDHTEIKTRVNEFLNQ